MSGFDSLTLAFKDWFDTPSCDLPDALRKRIDRDFVLIPWDGLSAEQRRSLAAQLDYQRDPANEQDRQFWFEFFRRKEDLKAKILEWEAADTPTASDLALSETRLRELHGELARLEVQEQQARGDSGPGHPRLDGGRETSILSPGPSVQYVAYPKAMHQLASRLAATPEELAAWIFAGPEHGGIAAYMNANELNPPPRFRFPTGSDSHSYVSPMMVCWFRADEVEQFAPAERYITGATLIERWSKNPSLEAEAFIHAKIAESRLLDLHPIFGGTRGRFPEESDFPPLTSGLFALSEVARIEGEDFADDAARSDSSAPDSELHADALDNAGGGGTTGTDQGSSESSARDPEVGSPEWRSRAARTAANAKHDRPGGSRDKHARMRELWATGKYSTRDVCAEQECAALGMSFAAARKALRNTPTPSPC